MEYQKITKISRNSQQNNSKTVSNENDEEILNEKHISPEERSEILEQKIGLKYMMNHEKHITKVVKLDLRLQC